MGAKTFPAVSAILFFFNLREKQRVREREHEWGEGQREKQTPHRAGSPKQGSIPELWDHDPS